jgi:hypothetical protein
MSVLSYTIITLREHRRSNRVDTSENLITKPEDMYKGLHPRADIHRL